MRLPRTRRRLQDPSLIWIGLIRHASHRYDSNHASFSAAFLLILVPAMALLPLARRRLGRHWPLALGVLTFGVGYFVVLGVLSIYNVNQTRYPD